MGICEYMDFMRYETDFEEEIDIYNYHTIIGIYKDLSFQIFRKTASGIFNRNHKRFFKGCDII